MSGFYYSLITPIRPVENQAALDTPHLQRELIEVFDGPIHLTAKRNAFLRNITVTDFDPPTSPLVRLSAELFVGYTHGVDYSELGKIKLALPGLLGKAGYMTTGIMTFDNNRPTIEK